MPNGLEKHMNFNINNKLVFIDSFQFLSFSLDSLVKKLGESHFICLSQEVDGKVFDLVKQKVFYSYGHMSGLKSFKKNCQARKSFIVY